jgi:hypothetical protein
MTATRMIVSMRFDLDKSGQKQWMHDLILVCGLFVQFARGTDARTPGLTDQESVCQCPSSFWPWFTLTSRTAPQRQTSFIVVHPCARGLGLFDSTGAIKQR